MLIFVYLRSSRLHFLHFGIDSSIVNKEEKFEHVLGYWMHLEGFHVVSSHFWLCVSSVWPVRVLALFTCCAQVWPVVVTGLTGQSWADADALFSSSGLRAFVQGELHWFRGSLHVCRGSSLWFSELWFGGLRSLLEFCFVSDVSSRCHCLRGPRLVFFKWSCSFPLFGFRSLVGVSFCSFLLFFFSLLLLYVGVVNALIKGEIEDHVWFEDRWMVASLWDEWLTTLCWLILG
jgi:hypothetical protein